MKSIPFAFHVTHHIQSQSINAVIDFGDHYYYCLIPLPVLHITTYG